MNGEPDFFGVPEENMLAAKRRQPVGRLAADATVPSRWEIANLPPTELTKVLLTWMEHSATEIIPSRGQIALVKEVLVARKDVADLVDVISMCTHYIEGA